MIRLVLFLFLLPVLASAGALVPSGRIVWKSDVEGFGGLSGIEVAQDGTFLAISDRGMFFEGRLLHSAGRLSGVELTGRAPILDSKGRPLDARNTDAEGLAMTPEGRFFVSFESNQRVMEHADTETAATFLPRDPAFRSFNYNSGLEALALDPQGRVVAIPERSGKLTRPFPVYRLEGDVWTVPFSIPRTEGFLVTGADFGPDGRLYVLERDFTWRGGFSTRVRRFALTGDSLSAGETLLETPPGRLDNMEGISVWADSDGQTRLTLIADDNFNLLQNTVIAEYLVTD